jgi:peptidoglycan-associated lipoprotein
MKREFVVSSILLIVLTLLLGGCGCFMQQMKGEAPPPPAPEAKVVAPEVKPEMPAQAPPAVPAPVMAAQPMASVKDINFDFDKYNIRPGDAEILKQNAEWFKANPGKKMRIEGNCDERGTVEYNLVLGQKRADSTKNFLTGLGIDSTLLETLSYGKERPLCGEHNEECWARNRRTHFEPVQ